MDTMEAILTRRSVKRYRPDPVPDGLIDKVVEAGLYAASGMNRQSPILIAVTDKCLRDRLSAMNARILGMQTDPFYGAPAVIAVLADRSIPTAVCDGSLAIGNMMLAAHDLGLGSCWIHRAEEEFDSPEGKAILRELGIDGDYVGVGHCIIGYADGPPPEAPARRPGRVFRA